jgi:hypothetical protein
MAGSRGPLRAVLAPLRAVLEPPRSPRDQDHPRAKYPRIELLREHPKVVDSLRRGF